MSQVKDENGKMVDKYRFSSGSLYEFDACSDSYIHCFKHALARTEKKAISMYEGELNQCDAGFYNEY